MTTKTTFSIDAVKNNKRTFDSIVLQSLPPELAEVQLDFAFLLRATGLWAALSRQQRRHAKRVAPRLVALVDPATRCVTRYGISKIAHHRR